MNRERELLELAANFLCGELPSSSRANILEQIETELAKPEEAPYAYAIIGINASGRHHVHDIKKWTEDGSIDDGHLGEYWAGNIKLYSSPRPMQRLTDEEIKQFPIKAVGYPSLNNFIGFPRGTLGAYLSGWRDAENYHFSENSANTIMDAMIDNTTPLERTSPIQGERILHNSENS
jgi:hypothetical protein